VIVATDRKRNERRRKTVREEYQGKWKGKKMKEETK
jgi:hypothetical protein